MSGIETDSTKKEGGNFWMQAPPQMALPPSTRQPPWQEQRPLSPKKAAKKELISEHVKRPEKRLKDITMLICQHTTKLRDRWKIYHAHA